MAAISPETAVRNYLTFLSDPDSLRDPEEVKKLEAEVAGATDVVDQLMARAALRRAMAVDPGVYERAFIEHGKDWADANDVPAGVFEDMGVRSDVLQAAGFFGRTGRGIGRVAKKAAPMVGRASTPRRASVKSDELEAGILRLEEPFSIKEVTEKVGGSTITVTKAVKELEAQGKVKAAGERANERGRASRVWATVAP
jgi:hypothetical protein